MTDGLKAYRVINESEARWKELLGWNASHGWFFFGGGKLKQRLHALKGVPHVHIPSYVREFQWRYMESDFSLSSLSNIIHFC